MLKRVVEKKIYGVEVSVFLLLAALIIAGFWPVSTGLFALKNDDIIYFLPYRYNIVEALRSGHLPLWSPYIYMGFPLTGDIQSGAWNPVVWFFAFFGKYTLTSLHIELLIYLLLAGIGMYKFMTEIGFHRTISITVALAYTFSGYIIDSGQILCWVSSAALLPYTGLYFYRILHVPSPANAAKFALSNAALIVISGYPFFFIISQYLMTITLLVFTVHYIYKGELPHLKNIYRAVTIALALFCLLFMAPLLSYTDLFPFYNRGSGVSAERSVTNSFTFFSGISFLFPLAGTQRHPWFLDNVPNCRNIYIGIVLLPFIIAGFKNKPSWKWYLLCTFIIIMYLLSLGRQMPLRLWAYEHLPLFNTYRHPANFRLFISFGLLLIAARGMQNTLVGKMQGGMRLLKNGYIGITVVITLVTIYYMTDLSGKHLSLIGFSPLKLKAFLTSMNFGEAIFIGFLLQLPFLLLAIHFIRKKKADWLLPLAAANIITVSQPQIFITSVSKEPVKAYNQMIKEQPSGFPPPSVRDSIGIPDENISFLYEYKQPVEYFFNKRIAVNTFLNNPTIFSSYMSFVSDSSLARSIAKYPFIYFADSIELSGKNSPPTWLKKANPASNGTVQISTFGPNAMDLIINTDTTKHMVILQNNFPYWKARLNNEVIGIQTVNHTFMGIPIPPGRHLLSLRCKPDWLYTGLIISFTGLLLCLGIPLFYKYK